MNIHVERDNGRVYSVSNIGEDITLDELLEIFGGLAMQMTYHPESWKNAILSLAEEMQLD
jgi:hypothetical protein